MIFELDERHVNEYNSFSFMVSNPYECDSERGYCMLHVGAFKHSYWFKIPELFKPRTKWVNITTEQEPERGYTDYIRREYGFSCDKEALHIHYGIQPGSWSRNDPENSDHSKIYFIAWNQRRQVRCEYLNLDSSVHKRIKLNTNGSLNFDGMYDAEKSVPKITFKFNDFDGEEIEVECYIQETEYKRGVGLFKWVSLFCKRDIYKSLYLKFNKEVGYEKGSWKGGTTGHSCEIEGSETPLEALTRYGTTVEYYKNYGEKPRGFTNITQISP